jgi:RHS repeat-associated protein
VNMSVGQLVGYDRLHDVLGSVVALTNSVGQVVERYDYDPYGTTTIMDAAAVPLALKPIDPAAADGYYHDHDRDGDIDAADYTDLMDCVNNTPYDPMCIYTHDRTGDRRVDIVDVGVYLAYADDQGLAGGTSAPELVHYGRPLRLQFDADGDGRVDMFDWYAMQTCFTKNSTRCKYLFDDNGDGVVNFYDLANFKQAADGPQGGPGATQWRRKLVASRYGNPFMWTGQRYDATTGQYHFWARTYSPRLGRWLQRDPLGYVDGLSLYQYTMSSPLVFADGLGLLKAGKPNYQNDIAALKSRLRRLKSHDIQIAIGALRNAQLNLFDVSREFGRVTGSPSFGDFILSAGGLVITFIPGGVSIKVMTVSTKTAGGVVGGMGLGDMAYKYIVYKISSDDPEYLEEVAQLSRLLKRLIEQEASLRAEVERIQEEIRDVEQQIHDIYRLMHESDDSSPETSPPPPQGSTGFGGFWGGFVPVGFWGDFWGSFGSGSSGSGSSGSGSSGSGSRNSGGHPYDLGDFWEDVNRWGSPSGCDVP